MKWRWLAALTSDSNRFRSHCTDLMWICFSLLSEKEKANRSSWNDQDCRVIRLKNFTSNMEGCEVLCPLSECECGCLGKPVAVIIYLSVLFQYSPTWWHFWWCFTVYKHELVLRLRSSASPKSGCCESGACGSNYSSCCWGEITCVSWHDSRERERVWHRVHLLERDTRLRLRLHPTRYGRRKWKKHLNQPKVVSGLGRVSQKQLLFQ